MRRLQLGVPADRCDTDPSIDGGRLALSGYLWVDQHWRRRIVRVPTLGSNLELASNREDRTDAPGRGPDHLASASACRVNRSTGNDVHHTRATWCHNGTEIVPTPRKTKLQVCGLSLVV